MLDIWEVTIPELTGEEPRRAYVYLPESYEEDTQRRYPVLYMFDGHNVFLDEDATYGKSWGMKDFMDETEIPVIIAAVECNHGVNNDRLEEYTPYPFMDPYCGHIKAKGKKYMRWLIEEFKTYIDDNYRTLPDRDHTMIAGSSMGGLMSFYAVIRHNDVFSRAACLSPSLFFVKKKLSSLVEHAKVDPNTIIYMDCGSEEVAYHTDLIKIYCNFISQTVRKGIYVTTRVVPHGDHSEASWERQIPIFMETLLYGMEWDDEI